MRLLLVAAALMLAAPLSAYSRPPLEAYGRLPALENVQISPSGERLAFVTVAGEERSVVATTVDAKPLASVKAGDVRVRWLRWAGEGHVLITTSQADRVGPSSHHASSCMASLPWMWRAGEHGHSPLES